MTARLVARAWTAALAVVVAMPGMLRAQSMDELAPPERERIGSPERFVLELKGGPYEPAGGTAFEEVFGSAAGPLLAAEFTVLIFELEDVAALGVASGIGWAHYSAPALVSGGASVQVSESTDLTLFPVPVLAVLRIDALARHWNIPFVVTGKLGADLVFWSASTGGVDDGENVSVGLRWAVQLALELDWFDQRAMRSLDEEFGINHATVFAELFGSTASSTLDVSPNAGFALTGGLGLVF